MTKLIHKKQFAVLAVLLIAVVYGITNLVGSYAVAAGSAEPPAPLVSADGNLQPRTRIDALGQEVPMTHDDLLVEVATLVPGFGGFYRDPEDKTTTVILLDDPAKLMKAKNALVRVFGESILKSDSVRAESADYDIRTLKGWYDDAVRVGIRQIFDVVLSTGIDESTNRISVGITDMSQAAAIYSHFLEKGVPASAVDIFHLKGLVFDADLGDL